MSPHANTTCIRALVTMPPGGNRQIFGRALLIQRLASLEDLKGPGRWMALNQNHLSLSGNHRLGNVRQSDILMCPLFLEGFFFGVLCGKGQILKWNVFLWRDTFKLTGCVVECCDFLLSFIGICHSIRNSIIL